MLLSPMKRSWPSLSLSACSNTLRQRAGLMKGSRPSITSIKASALSRSSHMGRAAVAVSVALVACACGHHGRVPPVLAPLRSALKKSVEAGSSTITSDLLRKLLR